MKLPFNFILTISQTIELRKFQKIEASIREAETSVPSPDTPTSIYIVLVCCPIEYGVNFEEAYIKSSQIVFKTRHFAWFPLQDKDYARCKVTTDPILQRNAPPVG